MRAKWERTWRHSDSQEVGLEAAILERKRNSSLVKRLCTDNSTGLKYRAEAADLMILRSHVLVGEHSVRRRSSTERTNGADRRDPAGISSDKGGENPPRRKSKVS